AIVGSGPAAAAAIQAISSSHKSVQLSLFDGGKELPRHNTELSVAQLYRNVKSKYGLMFPPLKTHFGERLAFHEIDNTTAVLKNNYFGGLSNFWGATVLPFTPADFRGLPFGATELHPYY